MIHISDMLDKIVHMFPELRLKLHIAGIRMRPDIFVKKNLQVAIIFSVSIEVLCFILFLKNRSGMANLVWILPLAFLIIFFVLMKAPDGKIAKKAKEIDREILFAGRYLLIKLESGMPLINSLIEASRSYGISNQYFKDIVRDIELGTPIEQALQNAMSFTPSAKFKRILFQINNALRIGIDVRQTLEAVLEDIAHEQLIEIQKYGKKLNSFTLFYMLLAIVVPSLGLTLAVVVASLTSISVDLTVFFGILFFLALIQLMFISIFKMIRPKVNI